MRWWQELRRLEELMTSTPKVIQSGKIWAQRTTREVLWSIMKMKKTDVGVLHIVSKDNAVDGCIGLANGMYILGASTESGLSGYAAVKVLLTMSDGNFKYLDYTDNSIGELDQRLKIRVTHLVNLLPNLPDKIDQVQGTNTLNRIRAMDPEELNAIKKAAETGKTQDILKQIRSFEDKSMRWRAAALWGTFAIIAAGVTAAILLHH
jgi:hypothetical protein